MKLLVVVDMQNDFIDGSLGTPEAQAIVQNVVNKIKSWDGEIICTKDTHDVNYLTTREGRYLPVEHCINGTHGCDIADPVWAVLIANERLIRIFDKNTFGSVELAQKVGESMAYDHIELVGLCTDICVVSNALLLKAYCPEANIAVDASCCAGVTPESHAAALATMKMCQIDIIEE